MRRGFIDWLVVKTSILVFAIVLVVAFFLLVDFQFYFADRDVALKNLEDLSFVMDSACSSPYNIEFTADIPGAYAYCQYDNSNPVLYYGYKGFEGRRYVSCCFSGGPHNFRKLKIEKVDGQVSVVGVD